MASLTVFRDFYHNLFFYSCTTRCRSQSLFTFVFGNNISEINVYKQILLDVQLELNVPLPYAVFACFKYRHFAGRFKDFRPSDKFDNPYLIIPWVTNDNSEHLCELVSGTCFWVLGTLLYLHDHCPYITYYCFCCQSFIIILQKC